MSADPYATVADVLEAIDVDAAWRRARAVLDALVDPTDEASVNRAAEGAAREAWYAQMLYLRAKRDTLRLEEQCDHDLGTLRRAALDHLMAEVEGKKINAGRVTNDLIEWTAREQAPGAWQELVDRKSRAKMVREALEGLPEKLMERSRRIGDLRGPSRAEVTNRGASRR